MAKSTSTATRPTISPYTVGAAFDHQKIDWDNDEYGSAMWELYRTDRRAYYKKYHSK